MTTDNPPVIVGVDGSDASVDALRWAAEYAAATGHPVVAVGVWHFPPTFGYVPVADPEDYAVDMRVTVEEAIEKVRADGTTVDIRPRVLQGDPAGVLVHEAREAVALVIGSRGHGALASAPLGSVSSYCAHHAVGTVVIVRPGGAR